MYDLFIKDGDEIFITYLIKKMNFKGESRDEWYEKGGRVIHWPKKPGEFIVFEDYTAYERHERDSYDGINPKLVMLNPSNQHIVEIRKMTQEESDNCGMKWKRETWEATNKMREESERGLA